METSIRKLVKSPEEVKIFYRKLDLQMQAIYYSLIKIFKEQNRPDLIRELVEIQKGYPK